MDESENEVDINKLVNELKKDESISEDNKKEEWFNIKGIINDLGKIMELYGEKKWEVVGEKFNVGCDWGNYIV